MKPAQIPAFLAGLLFTIALRLVPHIPNFEPIIGSTMPFAKKLGAWSGAAFAFLALVSIDFIQGRVGLWTIFDGAAYAALGFVAYYYLKNKAPTARNFVVFSVPAVLAYDALTAAFFGWQFGQPLAVTFAGQVPFTLAHLAGAIFYAAVLSPLLYRYALATPEEVSALAAKPSPALLRAKK